TAKPGVFIFAARCSAEPCSAEAFPAMLQLRREPLLQPPAKSTPPQPSPSLREREGAKRQCRAMLGRGFPGHAAVTTRTAASTSCKKHPSPTLPFATRKGGGKANRHRRH